MIISVQDRIYEHVGKFAVWFSIYQPNIGITKSFKLFNSKLEALWYQQTLMKNIK